jgi:hypothetical protein
MMGRRWLTPVIIPTQEVEIRRITVQSQPRKNSVRPYLKKQPSQRRAGGMAQDVGPEFKPQYHTQKKKGTVPT